jgi:BirA family transcriptional regulator, biotin operon repressor / biotin---[acetyl-CoA-carboxylase] ligase
MRHDVLAALKAAEGTVSGQRLADRLGISRVAVWKQVRELRTLGYAIGSSPKGYYLESSPDLLNAAEFPGWESRIHHAAVVDSTMRQARLLARRGAVEGTIVVAESQTSGRGRLDRSWRSPAGGIYLTLITRPRVPPAYAARVSLLVAVVVSEVIERLYGLSARVKWPNDVLIEEGKVCGILAEMETECDAVRFVNVGMGLNANSSISGQQSGAVSLRELLGRPVDRVQLVREIVAGSLERLPQLDGGAVLDDWRRRTMTLGREVTIVGSNQPIEGIAVDITTTGALLVRTADGHVHEVMAGDCVHARH